MTDETKVTSLRALCWGVVVILPTGVICWLAHIPTIAIVAVALPFMLVAEVVFRKLLRVCGLWGPHTGTEPGAAPKGGKPAPSKPGAVEGPASVT